MEVKKFRKVPDLTAIVLAGGKSSRIGVNKNKAMLKLNGKYLLDIIISKLKYITEDIIIVGPPEKYPSYKKVTSDLFPQKNPLIGIYSGLKASSSCYNLVVGCDMPFLKVELLRYMIDKIDSNNVVIPRYGDKYIEPLCAIYSKDCLRVIKKNIESKIFPVRKILPYIRVKFIEEEEIKKIDPQLDSFFNVNFIKDLVEAEKLIKRNGCIDN
ncbi:MAG: molybdenum cofactor guanylyltransferase [Candidatus Caldatribacteriota bacterium]|nr:molybdenum cofactor guanylyltransferase [Candidatus Caldatribacteriota bacterium]